jgi:putative membrane protein
MQFIKIHTENKTLRHLTVAVSLLLAVMFPVGIVCMAGGLLAREYQWTSTLFLGVQSLLTFVLLWTASSFGRAAVITAMVGIAAIVIEFVGLATGVPFGTYYYSYTLEPFVVSNVPLAIVFAWHVLIVNIVLLSRRGAVQARSAAARCITGGVLLLGIDIMLEPFASFVNRYWTWQGGIVPPQNYAAWFVLGTLLIAAVHAVLPARKPHPLEGRVSLPGIILGMTAAQCIIINGLHGYWLPTIIGIVLIAGAYWRLRHGEV